MASELLTMKPQMSKFNRQTYFCLHHAQTYDIYIKVFLIFNATDTNIVIVIALNTTIRNVISCFLFLKLLVVINIVQQRFPNCESLLGQSQ